MLFVLVMMVVFADDLAWLLLDPEYTNFAPTYEYERRFHSDMTQSMIALRVQGTDSQTEMVMD